MPNQRRRRPLQDEGRKDRKDFRQRAEMSRTQRNRIEEHRERRERKREIRRSRRQQVDSVRSPKEDLRTERWDSRILPVEDSFLARPVGQPHELPVVIGERWRLSANQSAASSVTTLIDFDATDFTTERNGYPRLYDETTSLWRVPAGLSGIWMIHSQVGWSVDSNSGERIIEHEINASGLTIGYTQIRPAANIGTFHELVTIYDLEEGDEIEINALQTSATTLNILGGGSGNATLTEMIFLGK